MWENCVGCGEGLFAGDAFCGNCGRPQAAGAGSTQPQEQRATVPAGRAAQAGPGPQAGRGPQTGRGPQGRPGPGPGPVPAARMGEPGAGLIRIFAKPTPPTGAPAAEPDSGLAAGTSPAAEPVAPGGSDSWFAPACPPNAPADTLFAPDDVLSAPSAPWVAAEDGPFPASGGPLPPPSQPSTAPTWPAEPAEAAVTPTDTLAEQVIPLPVRPAGRHGSMAAPEPGSGVAEGASGSAPDVAAAGLPWVRLTGHGSFDPAGNNRILLQLLRQAAIFAAIYALIQTGTLLAFLALGAFSLGMNKALGLEMISLKVVALVLAIPFWLIPVPALLGQWAMLAEGAAASAKEAFQRMSAAFSAHGIPVDALEVHTVIPPGEDAREYLEVRRERFRGFLACFPHGHDLYLGWTFWLRMSPARLLLLIIGRRLRHLGGGGDIERALRAESARALVAAMHSAVLAGTEDPVLEPGDPPLPGGPGPDVSVRVG